MTVSKITTTNYSKTTKTGVGVGTESKMFPRGQAAAKINTGLPVGKGRLCACTLKAWESADATVMVNWSSRRVNAFLPLAK